MSEIELADKLGGFENELMIQSDEQRTGDPRIAAFALASLTSMRENPDFATVVGQMFVDRPDIEPAHGVNLTLRALQKQLLRNADELGYPEAYTTPEPWSEAIAEVSNMRNLEAYDNFVGDITLRNVQSNVADRYKAFAILYHWLRARIGEKPSMLDVGCSQNQGLKKLSLDDAKGFALVTAVEENDETDFGLTQVTNSFLTRGHELGQSMGIDIMDAEDVGNKEWARSCSFYPSELLLEGKRDEYERLEHARPDNVSFYQGDFAHLDMDDFLRHSPVDKFGIVIFSTVLYQVSPEDRTLMLKNARELVKPGGLIIIQDFATIDPDDNSKLAFHHNWFKQSYLYSTIVLDPDDSSGELYEAFRWENGRCRKMRIGPGLGKLVIDKEIRPHQRD